MEYSQKFIPEGWENTTQAFSLEELNRASINGNIMQAKVTKCDTNYNLYSSTPQGGLTGVDDEEYLTDEIIFINDCPKKANRSVSIERMNRLSKDYYEMGEYACREALIMFNAKKNS